MILRYASYACRHIRALFMIVLLFYCLNIILGLCFNVNAIPTASNINTNSKVNNNSSNGNNNNNINSNIKVGYNNKNNDMNNNSNNSGAAKRSLHERSNLPGPNDKSTSEWTELLQTAPPGCTENNNCRHMTGECDDNFKSQVIRESFITSKSDSGRNNVRITIHYSLPNTDLQIELYDKVEGHKVPFVYPRDGTIIACVPSGHLYQLSLKSPKAASYDGSLVNQAQSKYPAKYQANYNYLNFNSNIYGNGNGIGTNDEIDGFRNNDVKSIAYSIWMEEDNEIYTNDNSIVIDNHKSCEIDSDSGKFINLDSIRWSTYTDTT